MQMADLVKYEVLRDHEGDKPYSVGDTREAYPSDVAHLVGKTLAVKKAPENKGRK
jgi:hypothetical protein